LPARPDGQPWAPSPSQQWERQARGGAPPRFKDGISQIVDWLWLIDDLEQSATFEAQFGQRPINITALLVLGRDNGVSVLDRRQLEWHRNHVVVKGGWSSYVEQDRLCSALLEPPERLR